MKHKWNVLLTMSVGLGLYLLFNLTIETAYLVVPALAGIGICIYVIKKSKDARKEILRIIEGF